ncbi:biliverdin-producing heme oxygenase [Sphingobacterium corticibacterium]|uniref:Heme oxygenase n=1 Tax=Sphingobacterium corticibacterium TaxID=2484746 RepID=A0A4Q6XQJ9_9SPHI|nr:biliverdin-producing heme oxygenase [Sphingobacterium corticibacterium]RZF59702.1 heme oxygenase [Sphingobacterium corticibacterium]
MLSTKIKETTKVGHQETEKKVVLRIKGISNDADYVELLKCFYAYFHAVEKAIAPYIEKVLPDYRERRNSSYIKADIEALGGTTDELPVAIAPEVNDAVQAMGALYVLEGSIMGGPYIVQMLQKKGIEKGFSFFSGYGAESGQKWGSFTAVLNALPENELDKVKAIDTANETFRRFGNVFDGADLPASSMLG